MVDLRLRRISETFPPQCACCLAPTSDSRRIFKRQLGRSMGGRTALEEKELRVPYCTFCNRHADWTTGGGMIGVVVSFVAFVLLFWVGVAFVLGMVDIATDYGDSSPLVDEVGGLIAAFVLAGLFSWRRYYRRPREPVGPEHGSKKEAVIIRRHGEDEVTLRIHNDGWAEKLLELNPSAKRL